MRFLGKILFVFTIFVVLLVISSLFYYYYQTQQGGSSGQIGQIINAKDHAPTFSGEIVYVSGGPQGIYTANPNSGKTELLREIPGIEREITISPSGDKLAYGVASGTKAILYVTPFPSGRPVAVTKPANNLMPTFSFDGKQLVYVQDYGEVFRALLDVNLLTMKTKPYIHPRHWYSDPKFLPDGDIACTSYLGSKDQIALLDRKTGDEINLTNNNYGNMMPAVSPDGKKVVFVSNRDGNPEIYTMDADGNNEHRLTFTSNVDYQDPNWSPDGKSIVYSSNQGEGHYHLYIMDAEGNPLKQLTSGNQDDFSPVWVQAQTKDQSQDQEQNQ